MRAEIVAIDISVSPTRTTLHVLPDMSFPISAVVITKNEEANISACLETLAFADEIVVVDSESVDRTAEIARRYTNNVYIREWGGHADQRNFAASVASHDWVLFVDADERVSPQLGREIGLMLAKNPSLVGFRCSIREFMFGGWIDHGGWTTPNYLRLYRRSCGSWHGAVHESVALDGPVGVLKNPILHFSHLSISRFLAKMNTYTEIEAKNRLGIGRRSRLWLTLPRFVWTLCGRFLYRRGYRDGRRGFVLAVLMAIYYTIEELQLWGLEATKASAWNYSQEADVFRDATDHPVTHVNVEWSA
jgi:glycosyltransferase involved in cell wall biosynthesis